MKLKELLTNIQYDVELRIIDKCPPAIEINSDESFTVDKIELLERTVESLYPSKFNLNTLIIHLT